MLVADKTKLKCFEHQEIYSNLNQKIADAMHMFVTYARQIEEEYVKIEALKGFIFSDGVREEVDDVSLYVPIVTTLPFCV